MWIKIQKVKLHYELCFTNVIYIPLKNGTLLKQNLHFLIPSRLFSNNNNCNVGEYLFYDDSILKLPYLVQANSKKTKNKNKLGS